MKKVGILTFYNAHNYGAMLQAYALQEYISSLDGYEAYIINYRNKIIDKRNKLSNWNDNVIKSFLKNIAKFMLYRKKHSNRQKSFEKFLNKKYNLTPIYKNQKELKNCNNLDIYITGSDQVWNPEITKSSIDSYMLDFAPKNSTKISYAASIGNNVNSPEIIEKFKTNLSQLDYISVREESAKNKLEKWLSKDIKVTLDPTLLLDSSFWLENIKKENIVQEKYIFAYQVEDNEEYTKTVNYLSEKTGLKVVHFEKRNNHYQNILKNAYECGPIDFITLVKNAEYVVSTSFHGTVFSTIFQKNFLVIPHTTRGSRIEDYLNKLNLQDRIIKKFDKKKIDKEIKKTIDYDKIDKIIEKERKESQDFLKKALKGE